MRNFNTLLLLISLILILSGCGFVGSHYINSYDPPGFFSGIWHGLIAPYTLILRIFMDIHMYAVPNTGWFYDLGFLLGLIGSIPIGWLAAIVAVACHLADFSLLEVIAKFRRGY